MPGLAGHNPTWKRQLRNPLGILAMLAVPVVLLALWVAYGGPADRWVSLLLIGWTLTGIVPAAIGGRRDENVEMRWRSLPTGAGERYGAAFIGLFPLALIAGELLVLAGLAVGPQAFRSPYLLTVGALAPAVMVAFGLAVAAWSRTTWQLAGLLGLALLACLWALLPGVGGPLLEVLPTGQAKEALLALPKFDTAPMLGLAALIQLSLLGLVFGLVGVVGYGRR